MILIRTLHALGYKIVRHAAERGRLPRLAPDALPWYRELYRLHEEVRAQRGWLTFDDMLLLGWEALVRHPDVLAFWQCSYDAVIVDEFQDVNLAQAEILDLLTRPHANYMAIGDDDQTIYGFRGASMGFFRDFGRRYGAAIYAITDNFRCQASQAAPPDVRRRIAGRLLALVQAVAERDAVSRLGISAADVQLWSCFAPEPDPKLARPFPDLDALCPSPGARRSRRAGAGPSRAQQAPPDYRVGELVRHQQFGQGVVVAVEAGTARRQAVWYVTVEFRRWGLVKLLASLAPLQRDA